MLVTRRYGAQELDRYRRQWQRQGAVVLRPLGADRQGSVLDIDLAPQQRTDLLPSAPKQDQKPDDAAVVVVLTGLPNSGEFSTAKHTFARARAGVGPVGGDRRVAVGQTLARGPNEERTQVLRDSAPLPCRAL